MKCINKSLCESWNFYSWENVFLISFNIQGRSKILKTNCKILSQSTVRNKYVLLPASLPANENVRRLSVNHAEDCFPCALFLRRGSLHTRMHAICQQRIRYSTKRQPHNLCVRPSQSSSCARKSSRRHRANGVTQTCAVSNPICRRRATVHPTLHVSQTFQWSLFTWPIDPVASTETDPTRLVCNLVRYDCSVRWKKTALSNRKLFRITCLSFL